MAYAIHTFDTQDLVEAPSIVQIQSLAGFDNKILVGSTNGELLLFEVNTSTNQNVDLKLLHHDRYFSLGNILQIEVKSFGRDKLLFSLSNNGIQIHKIASEDCSIVRFSTKSETKGASLFACNQLQSAVKPFVQVCVAIGQTLHLFFLKNDKLEKFQKYVKLDSAAKQIVWYKANICIGTSHGYLIYDVSSTIK